MSTTNVQSLQDKHQLYQLLEGYRITRRKKPVARLVSEPLMQAVEELLESNPGLADTLALMLNDKVSKEVDKGKADSDAGKTRPAREFFDEV